jgi:hypothetical protein
MDFLNWDVDFFTDFTTALPNSLEPEIRRKQITIRKTEKADS